jgi:uncharacterized protein (TIGR03437 family)
MCRKDTNRRLAVLTVVAGLGALSASAQTAPLALDWRHIGNSGLDLSIAGVATGPVDRVWFSADGSKLYARTGSGRVFQTEDFERWRAASDVAAPAVAAADASGVPETGAALRAVGGGSGRLYGFGRNAWRSDDGGSNWSNLTDYKGASIVGGTVTDLAVSPRDPEELAMAGPRGVWRSVDGGLSWSGLNQTLPNLPVARLLAVPGGGRGVRLGLGGSDAMEVEWAPGEKTAWRPADAFELRRDATLKQALEARLKKTITAVAALGSFVYAGDSEGRLWASADLGETWAQFGLIETGAVEAIFIDPKDPRVALAALRMPATPSSIQAKSAHVLRTMNGGIFWDDITSNLPDVAAHGIAADRTSGAVYVATDAGVFYTTTDLASAGRPTNWTAVSDKLPKSPAMDVRLDAGANQLYVALDGYGVYATIAPHRFRDVRVVNAADYSSRAAAPGSLLSVLGANVQSARSANLNVPVLDATDTASQIQVPFEAKGNSLPLILDAASGRVLAGIALQSASPSIFVDPEGSPLILDADSGVLLDSMKPAHSNTRIQILATGLGRVTPDWPTGIAAPRSDPPRVVVQVQAWLDRAPVEVTQAVLAPGYIGFYLIEVQLPRIVNAGPAELYLQAEGHESNRVRLYIEP